jgi:archaemetzincin
MWYIRILFGLCFISCRFNFAHNESAQFQHELSIPKVIILPLGEMDSAYIAFLKKEIPKFYKVQVVLSDMKPLPGYAFYKPRQRYIADSLLHFLRSRSVNKSEYVLGVTAKDIATSNGNIVNWGVMGLGYQPGNACVISSFRIKNNLQSPHQVFDRFLKVALHELGHNFGLVHCPDQHCIMVDAEGKNKLDGEEKFCRNCTFLLQKMGFL